MNFNRFGSTGYMVNLVARLITLRMARALKPLGVAPGQLPVLFALSALGESTQGELAERGAIEQPTMALTLRRMERDDLIARSVDPSDKRRAIVTLTEHARRILPEIEAIANAINQTATEQIGGSQDLIDLLSQVANKLQDVEAIDAVVDSIRAAHESARHSA